MFPILHLYYTSLYIVKPKLNLLACASEFVCRIGNIMQSYISKFVMHMRSASAHMCGTFLWHCTTMAELPCPPTIGKRKAAASAQVYRGRTESDSLLEILQC